MRALWLTAVAVAALASVATAAQAQESSHSRQAPAGATQPAPPEALQPRPVQTQSFRRDAEPDTPQPAQTQAVRKRNRSVTTGQATRQATRQVSRQATRQVSRRATARASSVRRTSRPLPLYAQARSAERAAAVREVIVSPAGPPRTGLSAGFNEYITRMNIWSRPPWEIPATVGATVPLGIQVYGVPAEIVAIDPAFAGDQFVVVGDDVVILEPDSRRIVAMLSRTSGAYVAERDGGAGDHGLDHGSGAAGGSRQAQPRAGRRDPHGVAATGVSLSCGGPISSSAAWCRAPHPCAIFRSG